MQKNLEYWLRLSNSRHLSPYVYTRLLQCFGHPAAICEADAAALAACGVKPEAIAEIKQPNSRHIADLLTWREQPDRAILTLEDEQYPFYLKRIADPPLVLFVWGNPAVLSLRQLALVGSRRPSPGGLKAAEELAGALVRAGLTITSGLATGIDAASHRSALQAGGTTVAVLGSGLARIYPARHQRLAMDIAASGAVITEFSPETSALPMHFPRRNRIISGLSLGTCVVEAALRSGSLITAKLAADQGREVFAVPGSIYNSQSQGCHHLIQQGAKLTVEAADILNELGIASPSSPHKADKTLPSGLELDYDCRKLLQCVGFEATTVDQLVQRSGLACAKVAEILITLKLKGYIDAVEGGYFCR